MKEVKRENIGRIVVRGTNWVGDTVMSVAALRRLRKLFPDAHVTLVVRPWAEAIFMGTSFVDSLVLYDRRGMGSTIKQVLEWRLHKFDLAVLFQNAFEAALIPFLARVPLRIGYSTDGRRALLTHPLSLPEWRNRKHEVFYYLNIVEQLEGLLNTSGPISNVEVDCSLEVSESRQDQARKQLEAKVLHKGPTIALCPGSINSRAKRWPAERYAQLADLLIEERNANLLLVGSKEEIDVAAEVRAFMKHSPIDLTGSTDLAEAVALISVADLVVSNDTGPAHIASALGRPTLVIFGPTNPLTTRPYASSAEVVRHPPECAPCMLRDCPIDHRCMTAISVEEVYARTLRLLTVEKIVKSHYS